MLCIEVSSVYSLWLLLGHHNLNIGTENRDLYKQDIKFIVPGDQVQGVLGAGLQPSLFSDFDYAVRRFNLSLDLSSAQP